ncbi:MAG: hypothetical protein PVH92_10805 [Anaerolineales bacterium]
MDSTTSKLVTAGVLFLLTIISGMILSRSNRPLNIGLVTVHKLIAAGAMVLLGMAINQLFKAADGRIRVELSFTTIGAISFLALIATGGLLTREEMQLPALVFDIHKLAPLLALSSCAVSVYLLTKS